MKPRMGPSFTTFEDRPQTPFFSIPVRASDALAGQFSAWRILYENSRSFLLVIREIELVGGWTNPLNKNMLVEMGIFPQVGLKIKNIWNHHLVTVILLMVQTFGEKTTLEWWWDPVNHEIFTISSLNDGIFNNTLELQTTSFLLWTVWTKKSRQMIV